jgi:hypothetical protein
LQKEKSPGRCRGFDFTGGRERRNQYFAITGPPKV